MTTTHVWYAAYGSNCDDARFACYLAGGRPAGSTKQHVGCRDTTPATATAPIRLDYPVYFGGWSPYWDGAVAYLDPMVDTAATTFAVARRITVDQFGDVVAQECGGAVLSAPLPIDRVVTSGRVDIGGAYGTLLYAGMHEGEPVVTCTAPTRRGAARPATAYLDTIRRGLGAFHPGADLDGYLRDLVAAAPPASRRPRWLPHAIDPVDHTYGKAWSFDDEVDRWDDRHRHLHDHLDRWDDEFDDLVLDGDTLSDRTAINRSLSTTA